MTEQAVILCGGLGTRLGSAAGDLPKPMVEVGGKPVLRHAVDRLRDAGMREVLCAAGYRADAIRDYFAQHDCGLRVEVIAEEKPLGTAGSARGLLPRLADRFVVVYGDVFIDFDLAELIDADRRRSPSATLLVRPSDHPWDSDLVLVDDAWSVTGFIRASEPREYPRNLANAAVYVASRQVLQLIPEGTKADWVKDVFPAALREGLSLAAHPFSGRGYIKDMGTPQRLEAVRDYLRDRARVESARRHRLPIRAVFLDRDGVINEEIDLLTDPSDLKLLPGVAPAIRRLNEHGLKAVVITNQPVIARGLCSSGNLDRIHARLEELLAAEGARVDAIYYCPHHPETHHRDPRSVRELRVACECRKPAPGMLLRASREMGVDLAESIFVGDRSTDVEAAKRAGVRSVFIGASVPDSCRPDHVFGSLAETVTEMFAGTMGEIA
jgi:histidinol-phosphate phosphatase family protein